MATEQEDRVCKIHGLTSFARESSGQWKCRRCRTQYTNDYRRRLKATVVAEAGGKCVVCGYNRSIRALHFHHRDPKTKIFQIGTKHCSSIAKLRKEAAKCVLVCSNCHMEIEDGLLTCP